MWTDIASIVFVCVTANHMGFVKAVEEVAGSELPVINCVKCSTFWMTMFYMLFATHHIIPSLAVSFLCSYVAIWLEIAEGFIDTLYNRIYEQIYSE